jgi:hypothetical protein
MRRSRGRLVYCKADAPLLRGRPVGRPDLDADLLPELSVMDSSPPSVVSSSAALAEPDPDALGRSVGPAGALPPPERPERLGLNPLRKVEPATSLGLTSVGFGISDRAPLLVTPFCCRGRELSRAGGALTPPVAGPAVNPGSPTVHG